MRRFIAALTTALIMSGASAVAHPGAAPLITDSKTAPRVMSGEVSFEEVKGVHLFKGSPLREETKLLGAEPAPGAATRNTEIEIRDRPWRRLRHLRTQGFYSGVPYPSRRYSHGFYSGK